MNFYSNNLDRNKFLKIHLKYRKHFSKSFLIQNLGLFAGDKAFYKLLKCFEIVNEMNAPPKPKTPEKITRALIFKSLPFCIRRLSTPSILKVILKITIIAILVNKNKNILCMLSLN